MGLLHRPHTPEVSPGLESGNDLATDLGSTLEKLSKSRIFSEAPVRKKHVSRFLTCVDHQRSQNLVIFEWAHWDGFPPPLAPCSMPQNNFINCEGDGGPLASGTASVSEWPQTHKLLLFLRLQAAEPTPLVHSASFLLRALADDVFWTRRVWFIEGFGSGGTYLQRLTL